jgi:hypothetical protein
VIWLALLWPFLAGGLSLLFFRRRVTPGEWLCLLAVPLFMVWFSARKGHSMMTTDVEYWGGAVKTAEYHEAWNEKVPCRHKIRCVHKDAKGKSLHPDDGREHEFDVDEHPASWVVVDTNGQKIAINQSRFEELAARFKNRRFVEMNRRFHTRDGDQYVTDWSGDDETLEAVTTRHTYENRTLGSASVYNYEKVDPAKWGLFELPEITDVYRARTLLGITDVKAQTALDRINAHLGPRKQVRALVLVFADKPREAAFDQEAYWKGGNKNEFVVCIGTDKDGKVTWSHVFSWTEVEALKVEARNLVMEQAGQKLNLEPVVAWLGKNLERFQRKPFSDFSYLHVAPPLWLVVLTHAITLAFTAAWLILAVVRPNSLAES